MRSTKDIETGANGGAVPKKPVGRKEIEGSLEGFRELKSLTMAMGWMPFLCTECRNWLVANHESKKSPPSLPMQSFRQEATGPSSDSPSPPLSVSVPPMFFRRCPRLRRTVSPPWPNREGRRPEAERTFRRTSRGRASENL